MKTSNKKVQEIINASSFYKYDVRNNSVIQQVLNAFKQLIGKKYKVSEWKDKIADELPTYLYAGKTSDKIFQFCFVTKRVKVKGERRYELIALVDTFEKYNERKGLGLILKGE
jgi:hypothetical protein